MKLNLSNLLRILAHLIVAAPVIVAAIKPVIDEATKPKPKVTGS